VRVALPQAELLPGVHEDLVVPLWVARDGKVGVQRSDDTMHVPAILFASRQMLEPITRRYQPVPAADLARRGEHLAAWFAWLQDDTCTAAPTANGRLALRITGSGIRSLALPLPRGSWNLEVVPAAAGVGLRAASPTGAPTSPTIDVVNDNDVHTLELQVADGIGLPIWIDAITLRRRGK
jgi:hypothetical protein